MCFSQQSTVDDTLIVAADLDVSSTAEIAELGLEFTLAGVTALVADDVAVFDVRPINAGSSVSVMGSDGASIPEVGLLLYSCNKNGDVTQLDLFRVKFSGLPMNMTSNEFMTFEASFKALKDAVKNGVYKITTVTGAV